MADAFHIGLDDPELSGGGTLPVPAEPFARVTPKPYEAPNPTDPDWSNFPEARSTSNWADGEKPSTYAGVWGHSPPPAPPKPDGTDITGSMVGEPMAPPPAPGSTAPDAAGLPTAPAPEPALPMAGQANAALHGAVAGFHQAWENDTIFGGLQNAQADAIGDIISGAKSKLGVTLENPLTGGYVDEAQQRLIDRYKSNGGSGAYFDPNNPEGFFGGGDAWSRAVLKEELQIFDEKRQALAEKVRGDQAYDRAGENADALAMLDADTPASQLGAKLSHQANVSAAQAIPEGQGHYAALAGQFVGGTLGSFRDLVNILALGVGGGIEPTIARSYFGAAPRAFRILSDMAESGYHQALINLGLTAIEAPTHQAANEQRGEEHGLEPALQDMEGSVLAGFIPGAVIHGVKQLFNLHGVDSKPWIDEFLRQARGMPPDDHMSAASRAFMDDVRAWEKENGRSADAGPPGAGGDGEWYGNWKYGDGTEPPTGGAAGPPGPPGGPPRLEGPRNLLEGPRASAPPPAAPGAPPQLPAPTRPFPKSPDLPAASRNRPSETEITPEAIRSAESDANSAPPIPAGTPPAEALRVYTEAVRHAESPQVMAPPEPAMNAPPARDANFLPPDNLPEEATAGPGVVHRTTGYEGPHADLILNRIEHLQRRVDSGELSEEVEREMRGRIQTFQRHISNRDAALKEAGTPPAAVAAIRQIQPGDVITAKSDEGKIVTGEVSGWAGTGEISVRDADDIGHYVAPATISRIAKGARGGQVNNVPHLDPGEEFAHNGKPVTAGLRFPARDLLTDAKTYQYKDGGDANGVTDRLRTVKKWSPLSSGNLVVHERLDGKRYVVDGHQRTGLAKRLMAEDPSQDIKIPGFLFKEADGWTPEEVRAEAATKNIREGLGDSLDIARILRDRSDLWDDSLPVGRGDMKEARGLANLSDEAWRMVTNEKVRRDFASYVGNMAPDKAMHLAIMDDLVKFTPATQNEARMIIADAMEAGFNSNKVDQFDIFKDVLGENAPATTLRAERAKVYAAAERLLRDDKKIFGMLEEQAARISEAGNILADTNAERADRAGQLIQGLIKLATRRGPISAALNRAAQRVADKMDPTTSARTFLDELPALLKEEGLNVAQVPTAPKYDIDTPQGREEQVRDLEAEFMRKQPGFFSEAPVAKTLPEQRAAIHADMKQKLIDAGMPEAEAETGAALFTTRYMTRAARKGRLDPEQMYREANIQPRGDEQRAAAVTGATEPGQSFNQSATVPTFYSAVERAVTNAKQAKASPEQWISMLKNMPGVKPEEMKWLGLEDWLHEQKGTVTRDAVADYVRANSIQIQEVTKGTGLSDAQHARLAEMNNEYSDLAEEFSRLDKALTDALNKMDYEGAGLIEERTNRARDAMYAKSEEIRKAEREATAEPKYAGYRLPGGENYREMLLTLPPKSNAREVATAKALASADEAIRNGEEQIRLRESGLLSDDEIKAVQQRVREEGLRLHALFDRVGQSPEYAEAFDKYQELVTPLSEHDRLRGEIVTLNRALVDMKNDRRHLERNGADPDVYKSSHWDEPNIVAHVRFDDRVIDGKRALHVAEIQSDMHQSGRKHGYKPENPDPLEQRPFGEVPDAPFKTTWPELSIKRVIRHAAENGYDVLSWDTGATSADRYDLSKKIARIRLHGTGDNLHLSAWDHEGAPAVDMRRTTREGLADLIGKDVAEKILAEDEPTKQYGFRELSGLDLKVGGEGMVAFYDSIIPKTVAKLTKKFGGKVTSSEMAVPSANDHYTGPDLTHEQLTAIALDESLPMQVRSTARAVRGQMKNVGMSFKEAMEFVWAKELAEHIGGTMDREIAPREVHSLAITPALRDAAVNEGFPLFQENGESRGRITLRDNGAVIDLFKARNASTLPHEAGHLWLKEMAEDAADPEAPQQMKDDFKTVLDWLGAKDAASITTEQHEKFADGYVQWLREGKAPSAALANVFAKFREWLRSIYRTVKGLGKPIPDEIRRVFERLHATDDEIAAQRATEPAAAEPPPKAAAPKKAAKAAPAAKAPTLEEAQATWDKALEPVRGAAKEAWRGAEKEGARRQAQAQFQNAFEGALRGEEKPTGKWASAGHDAGTAFAKTKAGKAALAAVKKAKDTEAAYEAAQEPFPAPAAVTEPPKRGLAVLRAAVEADRALAQTIAEAGRPVKLEHPGGMTAVVGPDMSAPGMFRVTRFDKDGPIGHTQYATLEEAARGAISEGFKPQEPAKPAPAAKPAAAPAKPKKAAPVAKPEPEVAAATKVVDDAITAAKESPEPVDREIATVLEEEIKPLLELPAPEPQPPVEPPPSALNHAQDLAGRVAYHRGDVALIRGFSRLTGAPVYVGAKGDMRANYDIETDKTKLFTPEERAELVQAKRAAVAADEAANATNPDGPFEGDKRFAASPSVPAPLAAFAEKLIKRVGIKERVYLTTVEDARAAEFHGPFAAIGSAGVDTGTFGTTRRLPNGDHYVAVSIRPSDQLNLETVSHEIGHIVEKTSWKDAPQAVKDAVQKDYEAWRDAQRQPGVKARDLIRSTRTPEAAETITLPDENLAASDLDRRDSYWTAKDEWFADNVARWATSAEEPLTLVDKFFAAVAAALRKIHAALGEAYKPVKSMREWLESLRPTDIEEEAPPVTAAEAGVDGTKQTLMPGVEPVRDAERARLGAAAPLRGGNREMPAGGLFDDAARAQQDFFQMVPTEDGLKSRESIMTAVPKETAFAKFVGECQI